VDTGAAVSVMGIDWYHKLGGGPLEISNLKLKTYTGEIIRPLGVAWVNVRYNDQKAKLPIIVLEGAVPTLLGRNWLKHLVLDWKKLLAGKQDAGDLSTGVGGAKRKETIHVLEEKMEVEEMNSKVKTEVRKETNKKIQEIKTEVDGVTREARKNSINDKVNKLFANVKEKHPGVYKKCLQLWKKKETESKVKVQVEEMNEIFPKVFSKELGCLKDVKVNIPVPNDAQPKFFKPRPVPYALRDRVDDELDKLEGQKVWEKVKYSRWAAPIVVVLKDAKNPGGPIRICGDYKITINSAAPCDNYPIPNTSEQLATLAGGQKFSKIDLSQAYQQLELDEETRELLTINTHKGLYRPWRLQFGVHSATGIFQREMENILRGIPFTLVRIDDILVTGRNDWDHFVILITVLYSLEDAGFTVNRAKCVFFADEVTFCGYTINKSGVQPMKGNVDAVLKAPEPTSVTEVKSYLGMLNYYQNYLPSLSTVAEPIHKLLRKGVMWCWGADQKKSFATTKRMLSEAPLLVHFDPAKPIIVHTDASPYGLGSVLSHEHADGTERPVSYASRSLAVSERNYGHVEKEGLALVFAVKKFHHYLFGHEFTMYTDHKPLLGLFGENKGIPDRSAARIARWALLLSAYNYKLIYRQGILNGNADALSRLPLPVANNEVSQQVVGVHMMELVHAPVTEKDVARETLSDPVLSKVFTSVQEGWDDRDRKQESLKPYWMRKDELSVEGSCVLWGTRVIIPQSLRNTVLLELHDVHPGITRMKTLGRSYVWWPKMDEAIELTAKQCSVCAVNQSNPATAPIHPWETPAGPWMRIHLDFAGPLYGRMFLIVVDAYSKWLEVAIMREATSVATVNKLRQIFSTHGLPRVTVTDNGPAFVGEEFKRFMVKNGIKQVYSAPYHPASNGQAERMVRTFKEALKTMKAGDLQMKLDRLLYKYRIMPHSTTGKSPSELMFRREVRTPFHLLKPGGLSTESKPVEGGESVQKTRKFKVDDHVWARNFGEGEKWISGVISKVLGNVTYEVKFPGTGKEVSNRHINHLKERKTDMAEHHETQEAFDFEVESVQREVEVREQESGRIPIPALGAPHFNPGSSTLRRSSRVSRKPAWTTDFVPK
jgi:transposase InsO family protein